MNTELPIWPEPLAPPQTYRTLPEWPDTQILLGGQEIAYERARAEFYRARLEVAVEALQEIRERSKTSDIAKQRRLLAEKALAAIGSLPEKEG